MERKAAAGRSRGARKAPAAQPTPAKNGAQPAQGCGRRQGPGPPSGVRAQPALLREGSGSGAPEGKGGAPAGRSASSEESSPPRAEKGVPPAGSGSPPSEDRKGAAQKKQERRPPAKVVAGAASRDRDPGAPGEGPGREEGDATPPPRGKKMAQKKRGPSATKEPDPGSAETARARPRRPERTLRQVVQTLALPRLEVSEAARRVNQLRDLLVRAVAKNLLSCDYVRVGAGSYYEHVKISKPDEFDIMLKVPDVRVDLEPYNDGDYKGVYCFVKLKRNDHLKQLDNFVDEQRLLSASSILLALRNIIIKEVKTINDMKVTVERKKPGSPAVTLLIREPPSDISVDIILALEMCSKTLGSFRKDGPDIKKWLGKQQEKELNKMKLCLVPKNAKDGVQFKDTWRVSFSLAEKTIIQCHGNTKTCCEANGSKCCRKDCLKLLKYLLEQLKTKHQNRNQFKKFCSYHVKTAFFHTCTKMTSDEDWHPTKLDECFQRLLDYFLNCLRKAELKHFFIPDCNLFSSDLNCSLLAKVIENERTKGFPIFEQTEAV